MDDEALNLRDLPPVKEKVDEPDRLSQTLLRKADSCPRSAFLYLKHHGGAPSHAMARGSLLHAFAEELALELVVRGEKTLYAPQEGEDPVKAAQEVASLTKVMVEEVAIDHSDLVVPAAEMDRVREMAYHLAVGMDFDPEQIAGIERKFVLDLEILDWTISGKVDLLWFMSPTVLSVDDYKTTLAIPSAEEFSDSFQTKLYALLVMFGQPVETQRCGTCEGAGQALRGAGLESTGRPEMVTCPVCHGSGEVEVRLDPIGEHLTHIRARELYPRAKLRPNMRLTQREAVYSRMELVDFRGDVESTAMRIDSGLTTGKWPAIPGDHCSECPAALECPLPVHLRNFAGAISSPEQAAEAWAWAMRAKAEVAAAEEEVKRWAKAHDAGVRVGEKVFEFEVTHSRALRRRGREADWEGLQEAVQEAATFGTPFDVADWVREQTRAVFKGRPVTAGEEVLTGGNAGSGDDA